MEFEVILRAAGKEQSFTGTAMEVMLEMNRLSLVFGSCEMKIPMKVAFLEEIE